MQVLGISADSVTIQKEFEGKANLTISLLADAGKNVSNLYGVLNPQNGYPRRWTFVIDRQGTIRIIDKAVKAASHGKDLVEKINF